MKDIFPILSSLGLVDSEIKTYMSCLEKGPGTVVEITKNTGLSRQATYLAIEALTGRGLFTSQTRGKKRIFAAEPPSKLVAYAKRRDSEMHERIRDLEQLMPELELRSGGEKPVVKVYEGKEGIFAIIDDMRETKNKESIELTDLDAMYQVLSQEDLAVMREELQKSGTHVRGLYSGSAKPTKVSADRHFLADSMADFKSNIGIYGDKVALVTFEGKMHSIVIESPALVKSMSILFELALKGASKKD